jgi:hypothetical protein
VSVKFLTDKQLKSLKAIKQTEKDTYRDNDDYLGGESEEFPDCCGAIVLNGFPFRDYKYTLSRWEAAQFQLALNRMLKEGCKLMVAILNEPQQNSFGYIFKQFGGEQCVEPIVGNHKLKLYLWAFRKPISRKTKPVFGGSW